MGSDIQVVMFDLGGVLVELGDSPFPKAWFSHGHRFELSDWFKSDIALSFERGITTPIEFAQAIKNDLRLCASVEEIIEEFTKWPIGLYSGVSELLHSLSQSYTLAILTNTNQLHWPRIIGEFDLTSHCKHIFASHIMNVAKPEAAAFEYAIKSMNIPPGSMLFFDDNSENTTAAKELGIRAYTVKGQKELMHKVAELELLT